MLNESDNSAVINELDGPLRDAVEQVRGREVPRSRLRECLERVVELSPDDLDTDSRQSVLGEPSAHASHPMRRRWWVGGGAAIAVLCVLVFVQLSTTSVGLAAVARAMSLQPWIHVTLRIAVDGTESGDSEAWYSPSREVSATRREEWLAYHDHKLKVYYSYDSTEDILYRVPEVGTTRSQSFLADIAETLPVLLADNTAPDDPFAEIEFLNGRRSDLTLVNQEVEHSTDHGRESLDYSLTVRIRGDEHPIHILFRVDPDTKLPRLGRVTGQRNGRAHSIETTFDYPETGPQDIYAIGVPRDARLVDRVPTDDVARLIAGVEAGRIRFDDFRAVVVRYSDGRESWWHEHPEVVHRKGNRLRRDMSYNSRSRVTEPDDDVDVARWWRKRAAELQYSPARICIAGTDHVFEHRATTDSDGRHRLEIASVRSTESGLNHGQWIPAFWSLTPDYVARPPLGVPNQHMEAVVDTESSDGPEGTILLKVRRSGRVDSAPDPDANRRPPQPDEYRFWIDPSKEYLVMRMDMIGNGDDVESSYIVESVAQSPQGHWYPTRVRRTSSRADVEDEILEYHVDFGVDIPDTLFDVQEPLPVEQVLLKG